MLALAEDVAGIDSQGPLVLLADQALLGMKTNRAHARATIHRLPGTGCWRLKEQQNRRALATTANGERGRWSSARAGIHPGKHWAWGRAWPATAGSARIRRIGLRREDARLRPAPARKGSRLGLR